ncbi:DUF1294 domain-containing protein [Sphingopyxis granuli]|uniref:Nuclease (SNase domain-containing protein) n=1 Tax=Sphingopyxis granuli TaxID=267128 RepID=A0AA86L3C3_9SPHN|nr:DUF1294 domain-containing protein [Sphingopyxis granuli]AMG74979.1 Nuclease (SNase domain-containing protein) [Sphingopyxis granuli]
MTPYVLYWLIAANLIAFILMLVDKRRAETGAWRIPEATLLRWAMLGGAIGTFTASRLIRHKTRKQPFAGTMHFLVGAEIILLALWGLGLLNPLIRQAHIHLDPLAATALAYFPSAS